MENAKNAPEAPHHHESIISKRQFLAAALGLGGLMTAGSLLTHAGGPQEGNLIDRRGANRKAALAALAAGAMILPGCSGNKNKEKKLSTITAAALQQHIDGALEKGAIRWAPLGDVIASEKKVGCGDDRRREEVAGTFGGSTGRTILELTALEIASGREIPLEKIPGIVHERLAKIGGLHLHTDNDHGFHALAEKLHVPPADLPRLLRDPGNRRDEVIAALLNKDDEQKDCLACGHLKNMREHPKEYPNLDPNLTEAVLQATLEEKFNHSRVYLEVLEGPHRAEGVIFVEGDAKKEDDPVPLLPNTWGNHSFLTVNRTVESALDERFANAAKNLTGIEVDVDTFLRTADELGSKYLQATVSRLAAGLPQFKANFSSRDRQITVTAA